MTLRGIVLLGLLAYFLIAALFLALAGNAVLEAGVARAAEERLDRESALVGNILAPAIRNGTPDLQRRVDRIGRALAVRVTLISNEGEVLADSEVASNQLETLGDLSGRPEIREARKLGLGSALREDPRTGRRTAYFARLLTGPESQVGFARLALPAAELQPGGDGLGGRAVMAALLGVVLLGVPAYLIAARVSATIRRLARAANRGASMEPMEPIRADSGGVELRRLAASMERMRGELASEISTLERERGLLDMVLSGIREGLVAVDDTNHVVLANPSFRKQFADGSDQVEGRLLTELVREPLAVEAFGKAVQRGEAARVTVTVKFPSERIYDLLVTPLQEPGSGAIGIFVNVTKLRAMEEMRRAFVADLSHEMRTPLSSLGAALENLRGPAAANAEDREKFLDILGRNLKRMNALIEDLTDLSLIESGAIRLEMDWISVESAVREVVETLREKAERMQVSLSTSIPRGLRIRADRRRLDQALVNVVENAIKFNKPGGSVEIHVKEAGESTVFTIDDTGRGVPPADLEKIFHRFYRMDRGRSREEGGTGLGLAIVKHLMKVHDGSVRAELRDSGGLRIVLIFPRQPPAFPAAAG